MNFKATLKLGKLAIQIRTSRLKEKPIICAIGVDELNEMMTIFSVFVHSKADDIITDTAGPLRVVSRKDWVAQPPNNKPDPLDLPVARVIIAHTATEHCLTQVLQMVYPGSKTNTGCSIIALFSYLCFDFAGRVCASSACNSNISYRIAWVG